MKQTKLMLVFAALFLTGIMMNAQSKTKKWDFKKGEVLDILLFKGKPELPKLFPKYKETAFALALEKGYQPQPFLTVTETTQGGYQPDTFIIAKWTDLAGRKSFTNEILDKVPDFHDQRRAMWSSFYLAYYEVTKDISFEANPNKLLVATSYWKDDTGTFNTFKKEWLKKAKNNGAKVLLELTDAMSTVGYMYKPDYIVLTEWNDRASFDTFTKESMKMGEKGIQNVNQFIIK
ncbi:MAG: hypothetical protein AB8B59_14040 [Maribacter sp.]